ncbi:hypothetical protein [Desulfofustis glycolicus]|uniref:hypothetical protein n=1 Tax=Desulfofustis glycolicus TaxID=51195 RepID=UPI001FC9E193|nr:hypothetical protein [Desulfofustis glycolicus]
MLLYELVQAIRDNTDLALQDADYPQQRAQLKTMMILKTSLDAAMQLPGLCT